MKEWINTRYTRFTYKQRLYQRQDAKVQRVRAISTTCQVQMQACTSSLMFIVADQHFQDVMSRTWHLSIIRGVCVNMDGFIWGKKVNVLLSFLYYKPAYHVLLSQLTTKGLITQHVTKDASRNSVKCHETPARWWAATWMATKINVWPMSKSLTLTKKHLLSKQEWIE